jgi:hypothetical protein
MKVKMSEVVKGSDMAICRHLGIITMRNWWILEIKQQKLNVIITLAAL